MSHQQHTGDGTNTGTAATQDELINRVHGFPVDEKAAMPTLPTVDDLVPLWTRESGKRGALSKDERAAKAANAEQRKAAQALLDRLAAAEDRASSLVKRNGELSDQLGLSGSTISQMSTQVRTLQSQLRRMREHLPYGIITLARIASKTQRPVANVQIGDEQYPIMYYTLGDTYVEHKPGDRQHELHVDPVGTDSVVYRFDELPSDRQMDAIVAYLTDKDEPNTDASATAVIATCTSPDCRRCVQFKRDLRNVRTPGEHAAVIGKYKNDGVHADAQQYFDQMFDSAATGFDLSDLFGENLSGPMDLRGLLGNRFRRQHGDDWL